MSLFQKLCDTYDAMMPLMDFSDPEITPMAPVAHTVKRADICITIDNHGNFQSAKEMQRPKPGKNGQPGTPGDPKIIMPVTEQSISRTSAPDTMPHYLCEQLRYMIPDNAVPYESYVNQLSGWVNSAYSDPKIEAVLKYVKSGAIATDLQSAGFEFNDRALVCWDVIGLCNDSGPCWLDRGLINKLTAYHLERIAADHQIGLCMVTGKNAPLAESHPKGVLSWKPNAKIISFNSSGNNAFTYRGRFWDAYEAVSVSYEASQKAHNALAWLVENQGVKQRSVFGDRVFLAWTPSGVKLPPVGGFFNRADRSNPVVTPSDYKRQLRESLTAWRADMPDGEEVVFVMLESPTPGCLSIVYYNEMPGIEYLERFAKWEEICCCGNLSPALGHLAEYAYGTPRDGVPRASDELYRIHMQRLVMARLEGSPFPYDIYVNLVKNASRLMQYGATGIKGKGASPRQKLLRAACSAIRKYHYDTKKEELDMSLNRECADRDYLYGRLLAVAEHVERKALKKSGEERETTAVRFQQSFVQQPAATWLNIYNRLGPYFSRLRVGSRNYFRNEMQDIMNMLPVEPDPAKRNARLGDLYLLGYYHERAELNQYKSPDDGEQAAEDAEIENKEEQ